MHEELGLFCDIDAADISRQNFAQLFPDQINTWTVFVGGEHPGGPLDPRTEEAIQRAVVRLIDAVDKVTFNNFFFDTVTGLSVFNPTTAAPDRFADETVATYRELRPGVPKLGPGITFTLRFLYSGVGLRVEWPWIASGLRGCADEPAVALLAVGAGAPVPDNQRQAWHEEIAAEFRGAVEATGEAIASGLKTVAISAGLGLGLYFFLTRKGK